ncbi:zinc finger protein [Macleaya cordata]|uniref:Zinc finger protein n=1 Tax=Macleaya cordata TaxID=56857 RepID=A0A200RAM7_MACCD|nr:zinc finger protein [Macleaya cordata]
MTGDEDSEKRFQSIMDKLFDSPRSKTLSSSPGNGTSKSKKRGDSVKEGSESKNSSGSIISVGGFKRSAISSGSALSLEVPLCRPWDRGDLLRRLSTFKSMTWFGKPKAVSAVNCARRGWISVEMDIIACEACGARLLFSTPSSWTQQQIEKAAAVFSLKLDSGHRLLCPWIDNACEETLAQFPPTSAPALADGYKERYVALMQLSALPKVSSSAIDYMRSPRLENFLEQSSTLELGLGFADTSTIKYLGDEHEAVSPHLYYQAQKLIALCGWETRSLPYVVDCDVPSAQLAANAHSKESSTHVNGRNPGIIMCSTSGADEVMDVDEEQQSLSGLQSDPASVVLDCRLCGASVGLWAFSIARRPLELYRLIGSSEVSGQKNPANCDFISSSAFGAPRTDELGKENHVGCNGGVMSTSASTKENSFNLNLSIAGGPPPAKQNYRATVSLPVISRHLRVGITSNSDVRDRIMSDMSCLNESAQCDLKNTNSVQREKDHTDNTLCMQIVQPEDMGSLKRKRTEDEVCISGDDQSCLNSEFNKVDPLRNEKNDDDSSSQSREGLGIGSDATGTVGNGETSKKNPLMTFTDEASNHQQDKESSGISASTSEASYHVLSCVEANATADIAGQTDLQKGNEGEDVQKSLEVQVSKQKLEGVKNTMQSSDNNEIPAAHGLGKEVEQAQPDQAMEFDPIKQHRHFCPWIMSTGNAAPGWQQTLYALDRGKEPSHPSLADSPSSAPMFELDDPITSVRKLFMSPSSTKRRKATQGSS